MSLPRVINYERKVFITLTTDWLLKKFQSIRMLLTGTNLCEEV